MQKAAISALLLGTVLGASSENSLKTTSYELPRIQGALLLVHGYQPNGLLLVSANKTLMLQDWSDRYALPSISADGSIVASAQEMPSDLPGELRLIASTYSLSDGKWTSHPELEGVWGSVAVSPDGSKLACVTRGQIDVRNLSGLQNLGNSQLRILDLRTGQVTVATKPSERPGPSVSWSPDGRRIVFDMQVPGDSSSGLSAIAVLNVETGAISQIGLGRSPTWSPSGEWIAYAGYVEGNQSEPGGSQLYAGRYYSLSEHQFNLMSPNGTHSRVLMAWRSGVDDDAAPVWSPDSKELLLTRVHDPDKGTFDIYVFDLAAHKLTKEFSNTIATVYGWVEAK